MASTSTTTIKQTCATCNKGGGIAMCNGCQRSFCIKHFVEHRQDLSQQMEEIGHEHDLLRRDMNSDTNTHSLLIRIDQWEQEAIKTIQTTAKQARTDLQQLLNQTKHVFKNSIDDLTEELRACRESDNYTEIDIQKWFEKLKELRQMIENPSQINIGFENNSTSVLPLIRVSTSQRSFISSNQRKRMDPANHSTSQQYITFVNEEFGKTYGDIVMSSDGLTGMCTVSHYDGSCISGIRRYSSNKHSISFHVEIKKSLRIFFGILTASETLKGDISTVKSAYGWWDLGSSIVNGKPKDSSQTMVISEGDKIRLILDCDNRQIQLEHQRTNKLVTLPVNLEQCPFPWKIICRLDILGDCIRIIH